MTAYYNEIDPKAAAWLRELIRMGEIAPGVVDERSITDVRPDDLVGYDQCHFFAGIGVWSYALRQASWSDDRPVWTGSCPCQPFSSAGKGTGHGDERHLWPAFFHLIEQRRPIAVFGEQVESAIRHGWLDLVQADLEGIGYTFGAVGLPAAGFGAPHIRQRLFFVAHDDSERRHGEPVRLLVGEARPSCAKTAGSSGSGIMGNAEVGRGGALDRESGQGIRREEPVGGRSISGIMGNPDNEGSQGRSVRSGERAGELSSAPPGPANGFWRNAEWLPCRDGKWRATEPGAFPLVDGSSRGVVPGGDSGEPLNPNATSEARVMRLKGYGNAIVAPVAQAFIEAYMEEV